MTDETEGTEETAPEGNATEEAPADDAEKEEETEEKAEEAPADDAA